MMLKARHGLSLASGVAIFLMSVIVAGAQTTAATGKIQGTITDPSGAAVAGANVVIVNKASGQVTRSTTSSTGSYSSGTLTPGEYDVRVTAPRFRTSEFTTSVQAGATPAGNITLMPSALQINIAEATVEGHLTAQQVHQLPTNGRHFIDLVQLEPGVQMEDGMMLDPTKNGFLAVSIGGRAGRTTRIDVDGVDVTDETVGSTVLNIPLGSLEEVQVGQSSLDLSSGLTSSGTIALVTKSGTTQLHGELFGNFRDRRAGGANFPGGQDLPFQRNVFGGGFGGPIVKDRLFFFLAGERFKQDLFAPVVFSAPFTGLSGGYSSPYRETELNGRLDYQFHWHSARLFYKFTYDNNSVVAGFGGSNYSPFKNLNNTPAHAVGFDFGTGTLTHSIRFAYSKFQNHVNDAVTGTNIINPAPDVQLFFDNGGGFVSGPSFLAPQTTIQANKEFKYDGTKTYRSHLFRYGVSFNRIDVYANASFFGLAPQIALSTADQASAAGGPFAGGANNPLNYPVAGIIIGNGFGCFTEKKGFGFPCGALADTRFQFYAGDSWKVRPNFTLSYGLRYVRDTGRSDSDLAPIPCSATTLITCTGNLLDQFGFVKGLGNRVNQPDTNFGPQLGLAWDPHSSGKLVIRAGIGLYYDNTVFNNLLFDRVVRLSKGQFNAQPGDPCASGGQLIFPDGSVVTSVDGLDIRTQICGNPVGNVQTALGDLQKEFQTASAALGGNSPNPFFIGQLLNGLNSLLAPNFRTPRSVQMNIGFQRQIRQGTVLSVDYVRNVATHYLLGVDTNHVGDARYLNVDAALAAINATIDANLAPGTCDHATSAGASSQTAVNCYLNAVPGASIVDFASNGLDSGAQFLSGLPIELFGGTPDTGAAFPGINPLVGRNTMYFPAGRSVYSGLQMSLRSQVKDPAPGIHGLNLQLSYALSSFKSNVPYGGGIGDQDFLPFAASYTHPTRPFGPASQDRKHQISFGTILDMWRGARLSFIGHFDSPLAQSLWLPSGSGTPGEIFRTDVDGDGQFGGTGGFAQTGTNGFGDLLPGTQVGAFGRDVSAGGLGNVVSQYLNNSAGTLTAAGQALVSANLFTAAQLVTLGATMPGACGPNGLPLNPTQPSCVATPPSGNVGLGWLRTMDLSFGWPIRIKERFSIEPSVSAFNVFNFANFDGPTNKLLGLLNGAANTVSGATAANRASNRIGVGSGVFSFGAPRQMEFGLKLVF